MGDDEAVALVQLLLRRLAGVCPRDRLQVAGQALPVAGVAVGAHERRPHPLALGCRMDGHLREMPVGRLGVGLGPSWGILERLRAKNMSNVKKI